MTTSVEQSSFVCWPTRAFVLSPSQPNVFIRCSLIMSKLFHSQRRPTPFDIVTYCMCSVWHTHLQDVGLSAPLKFRPYGAIKICLLLLLLLSVFDNFQLPPTDPRDVLRSSWVMTIMLCTNVINCGQSLVGHKLTARFNIRLLCDLIFPSPEFGTKF